MVRGNELCDDIVWYQPGDRQFSGTHRGGAAVGQLLGGMMADPKSEDTFWAAA